MMILFSGKYSILNNVFSWIGLFIVQFLTLWLGNIIPWDQAIIDSLVFNSIFAFISIGLWYIVINNDLFGKISIDQIITHLSAFIISLIIWLFSSTHLLRLIFTDQPDYLQFLEKSINIRIFIGIVLYIINLLFFYLLKTIRQLRNKEEHEKQITKLLRDTELEALKTQINPHFLFNSLNSIHALTRSNPEKASEMILQLSDYMRYSLNRGGERLTTLQDEMMNLEKYLSIEKIRFGNKLNYTSSVTEESLGLKIPPMLLQPLFENAIKHGLYSVTEGFYLNVAITSSNKKLQIEIENNFDSKFPSKDLKGLGINNVKNRLLNIYGRSDLISITRNSDSGIFKIILNIPQYE